MQTISLELAKRLDEKGFRAESEFVWWGSGRPIIIAFPASTIDQEGIIARAYTFDELWAVALKEIEEDYLDYSLSLCFNPDTKLTRAVYHNEDEGRTLVAREHTLSAEAAGLLLEWCIDNGHVEVEG